MSNHSCPTPSLKKLPPSPTHFPTHAPMPTDVLAILSHTLPHTLTLVSCSSDLIPPVAHLNICRLLSDPLLPSRRPPRPPGRGSQMTKQYYYKPPEPCLKATNPLFIIIFGLPNDRG